MATKAIVFPYIPMPFGDFAGLKGRVTIEQAAQMLRCFALAGVPADLERWMPVNDVVMGGVSSSRLDLAGSGNCTGTVIGGYVYRGNAFPETKDRV